MRWTRPASVWTVCTSMPRAGRVEGPAGDPDVARHELEATAHLIAGERAATRLEKHVRVVKVTREHPQHSY